MKKKYTITALMGILMLISFISALYAGQNHSFPTNLTNPLYTVVGNSSNLDGLEITFEDGVITIFSDVLMAPDSFTLIFFDNVSKEVVVYEDGKTRTRYVSRDVVEYVPKYINSTEVVEVERVVDRIINNTETIGIEEVVADIEPKVESLSWKVISIAIIAMLLGIGLDWLFFRFKGDNVEIVEDIEGGLD